MDASTHVKAVCRAWLGRVAPGVTSEVLRRAKLGDGVVRGVMWQALYHMHVFLLARGVCGDGVHALTPRETPLRDFGAEPLTEEDVWCVQGWLHAAGFPLSGVYAPGDVVSTADLLLALVWVAAKGGVLVPQQADHAPRRPRVGTVPPPRPPPPPLPRTLPPAAMHRHVVHAVGRVELLLRSTTSSLRNVGALERRLRALQGAAGLSRHDVALAMDDGALAAEMEAVQARAGALRDAASEAKHLTVFYQWVADAASRRPGAHEDVAPFATPLVDDPEAALGGLEAALAGMGSALGARDAAFGRVRSAWKAAREDVTADDFAATCGAAFREVAAQVRQSHVAVDDEYVVAPPRCAEAEEPVEPPEEVAVEEPPPVEALQARLAQERSDAHGELAGLLAPLLELGVMEVVGFDGVDVM